jgi:hypothetical protein
MSRLIQFVEKDGLRRVGLVEAGGRLRVLEGTVRVYDLALEAARSRKSLESLAQSKAGAEADYERIAAERRLLAPLDHPDSAHFLVTGTGLSHLGSAQSRDAMHAKMGGLESELSDSMRMFKWGLEGGKPERGRIGVQPEWFFKGDGSSVVAPGQPLELPGFAGDGGEEAEIAGLYVIADDGSPLRVGFALGNEFSDHVTEKKNYLYLAHSKLRTCAIGPELLLGALPEDVQGTVRIVREGKEIWRASFGSGEANMSHSIANLEHHHFKYGRFRRPGDAHCHFFGTGTLSYAAGVTAEPGDLFEIESPAFGRPLVNPLGKRGEEQVVTVRAL